ncbi:MAG: hypothetical protein OHK0013_32030 [Sandaracinaceae bacterium]
MTTPTRPEETKTTSADSALGPYRSVDVAPRVPPRAVGRWMLVPAAVSIAVAAGLLLFAPPPGPSFSVFDLPTDVATGVTAFPGEEEALPEATPLAPLLDAAQPEALGMLAPNEGVTRVRRGDVLQFRFNRPMVRASQVGRALPEMPIPLEPVSGRGAVPGTATWTSRSTLTFVPSEAAFDTNLEARVLFPEGMTSLEGEPLYDDELERIVVMDGTPRAVRNDPRVSAGEPLALYFNAAVRAATLRDQLLVYEAGGGSRSIPFEVRERGPVGDLFRVDVLPRRALAPGSRIGVAIAPAYLTWGGELPGFYSFQIQPRPRFVGLGCTISDVGTAGCAYTESPGEIIDVEAELVLLASHALADVTAAQVQVRPALPGLEVSVSGEQLERRKHLVVRGEWEPDQVYEVRIGTLVTEAGERVMAPGPLAIRSRGHPAQVLVAGGEHTFERAARFALPFSGVNLGEAVLRVRPIAPGEEAAAALHPAAYVASTNAAVSPLAALAPSARPNRWGRGEIPLAAGGPTVVGLSATGSSEPDRIRTAIVQQTDLGVSAVATDEGVVVWVTSISTARPLAGVRVSAWNQTATPLGDGVTDEDGVAFIRIAGASALFGSSVIAASSGDDRALLVLDPRRAVSGGALGLATGAETLGSDVHATVIADRGAYRPGERVRAVTIARRVENGRAELAGPMPVEVRFWDPTGEIPYATVEGTLDDRGVVDAEIELPDPAPMGDWRIELVARDGTRTKLGETTISVTEYREPRLRVDVTRLAVGDQAPSAFLEAGDELRVAVRGRYLFGAPVTRGEVRYQVTRQGPAPLPSRWSELTFGPAQSPVRHAVLSEGTLEPDAAGEVRIAQALELNAPRRTRFTVSAEVTDASGESAATEVSYVVYPGEVELGMRRGPDWVGLGTTLAAEVVAIDHAGEPRAGIPIDVRVVREGWHGWWEWHGGDDPEHGSLQLRRAQQAETVASCRLTSGVEPVRCEHTPARPGTYRLVASTADGVVTERLVYVAGPDESPDRDPPGAPITLTPERDDYGVGDVARLAFECPWPEAEALLTIRQGSAQHQERRRVSAGGQVLEVPLTDAMVPNVHAALVLVRPRSGEPAATTDLHAPDLRFGAAEIRVRPRTSRLEVTIEHAAEEVRAGSAQEVAVQVRDASGAPVAGAEVVLWAVDEGTLRLTGYQVPDPTAGFFVRRPAQLAMDDVRRSLVSRLPGALETLPSGDGGYEGSASSLASRERYEPTILWQPRLRSGVDGRVTATFEIPERLTEYRVMAVAIDQGASSGSASSRLVATRPLVARPALPRFVTDGDEIGARVFVHNRGSDPVHARVTLRLADADGTLREVGSGEVDVATEAEADVTIPVRVEGLRSAAFVIEVEGGGERVVLRRELPVVPRGYFVRRSVLVAGTGSRTLQVGLPAGVTVGRMRATIASHPFVHGEALVDRIRASWWRSTASDAALVLAAAADARLSRGLHRTTFEARERDAAVAAALRRLVARQTETGGFAWYAASDGESPQATVLAAFALVEASQEGAPPIAPGVVVSPRARELAIERVVRLVRDGELQYYGREAMDDQALALRVLALVGRTDTAARDAAFARRQFASPFELAQVAATYEREDPRRHTLALEAARRILEPRAQDPGYVGDVRALAAACEAAASVSSARQSMRALLGRMLDAESTASPYDLAWVLRAQAAVAEGLARAGRAGALEGDPGLTLTLDGRPLTAAGPAAEGATRLELPFSELVAGACALEVRGAEGAPVFLSLDGEWAQPLTEAETAARGRGIALHRVLETENGVRLPPGARVAVGSLLRVRLFLYSETGIESALAVRDPHAAGLEPVDGGHRTSAQGALAALLGMSPSDEVTDARGALAMRTASYVRHVEHDVHASTYYLTRLGSSLAELTYGVRATTPGTFTVPPAEVVSERHPELVARSAATTLVVEP